MEERLQKLLAQAGHGSRRACEDLIIQGRVRVNGERAILGQKADPTHDLITLDGEPLTAPERLTYLLLHKPRGVVSSVEPQGERQTVLDLVRSPVRLYPVGRLDLDSEGLILLTNDGELANRLTHPRYEVEKEYRVLVKGAPDEARLDTWRRGVVIQDHETGQRVRTLPARVAREGPSHETTWLKVIMREGRKHEIRDVGLTLGLPVERLIRVRLGTLVLGDLRPGQWRPLTADEVRELKSPAAKPKPKRAPAAPRRDGPRASDDARRSGGAGKPGGSGRGGPRPGGADRPGGSGRSGPRPGGAGKPGGSGRGGPRPGGAGKPSGSGRGGPRPGGAGKPGGSGRRPGGSGTRRR